MQDRSDQTESSGRGRDEPVSSISTSRAPEKPRAAAFVGADAEIEDRADVSQSRARLEGENAALKRSLDDALEIGNEIVGLSREVRILADAVTRMQNVFLGDNGPSAQSSRIDALTEAVLDLSDRLNRSSEMLQALPGLGEGAVASPESSNVAAEQLHLILTSRSWRMLRPVRGVARIVRRLGSRLA